VPLVAVSSFPRTLGISSARVIAVDGGTGDSSDREETNMRTTQYIGLNGHANEFIQLARLTEIPNPHNKYGSGQGMFKEDLPYKRWVDDRGNFYYEVTQARPWSSGPILFTAIRMNLPEEDFQIFGWWIELNSQNYSPLEHGVPDGWDGVSEYINEADGLYYV